MIGAVARYLDRRIGGADLAREGMGKVFPESWTFLFGEVALYCFVVLVATGTYLALFFDASLTETVYEGSYAPLAGQEVSAAYGSTVRLSFDVRAGLLLRQMHHWAALLFTAAIVVHLLRIFFTGAFRRPRDLNWMIGVTLLILAIAEGFSGYSMLDDLLSGVGLVVAYGIAESVPLVGPWLATGLFGGQFPGEEIIGRLFVGHVFLLPAAITGLIVVHLLLVVRQQHTQHRGAGRTEHNIVGQRLWPTYATKAVALFFLTAGVIAALGGLVQINPVWLYGPFDEFYVTTGVQPDWYMGWLEGALRLFPPWELTVGGYMVPNPFFSTVLFPGLVFGAMYAYPAIERRLTGDTAEHHLLDRPRDAPVRTAFGAAVLAMMVVLFLSGSQDHLAAQWDLPITDVVWALRIGTLVVPVVVFVITRRVATDLRDSDRPPVGVDAYGELDAEGVPAAEQSA